MVMAKHSLHFMLSLDICMVYVFYHVLCALVCVPKFIVFYVLLGCKTNPLGDNKVKVEVEAFKVLHTNTGVFFYSG